MPAGPIYRVSALRSGEWWALESPDVDGMHTQVRDLDDAEAMARECIALLLDVPEGSFGIDVQVVRRDG